MKIKLLLLTFMLTLSVSLPAQDKVAMFIGYDNVAAIQDDDERAAANWFVTNYADGIVYTPSTISTLSTSDAKVLWVMTDREGLAQGYQNLPEAFRSSTAINALTSYVKAGGQLLLTNHATQLAVGVGRIASNYAPNIFGSGAGVDNADTWGIQPVIGNTYDHFNHAIYNGMDHVSGVYDHDILALIGGGWKEDHNCMWDLNAISVSDNPNRVKGWEDATNSTVLGTWQQVTDFCCAGIVDFEPTTEYKGRILAIGMAAYEWNQNSGTNTRQSQVQLLTANSLSYLLSTSTVDDSTDPTDPTDPTVDPQPGVTNIAMYIGAQDIASLTDDDERAAATWFHATYPNATIFTPSTISTLSTDNIKVVWVMADRQGLTQGYQNLPEAFSNSTTVTALSNFVKAKGRVLLTNHATQLAVAMGRIASNYAPNIFGSGAGVDNADTWGIQPVIGNTYDHFNHALYNGMDRVSGVYDHDILALIGSGWKEDHNCMWDLNAISVSDNPNRVKGWEDATNSTVLGTWQQVTDFCCAGIVDFGPTTVYQGRILAIGMAAYEWNQNNGTNPYQSQVEKLTANALTYLATVEDEEIINPNDDTELTRKVWFDMTVDGRTLTEKVSGSTCNVEGVFTPENVAGAQGMALRTDGTSTYAIPTIDTGALSTKVLTLTLWAAPETYPMMNHHDGISNDMGMIAGNYTDNSGFRFKLSSQGNYGFDCYVNGARVEVNAPGKLPCYEWSHLVATIDAVSGQVKLYRDGTLEATAGCATDGTINIGQTDFLIGKTRDDLRYNEGWLRNTYNGLIDDIEIYNGIMGVDQITGYTAERPADLSIPESRFADQAWRPRFHAMAGAQWGNETHGMTYHNGKYHLFYQKNANGSYWGRLHWGHISSENLYQWKEERIALAPSESYDLKGCWSGCVYEENGTPYILYTGVDNERARIIQAHPDDNSIETWTKDGVKIDGRPDGYDDFRDPFYFTANGQKYIIVGSGRNGKGTATLHQYENGNWVSKGSFFSGTDASKHGTYWEMPNVTDMGNGKWLFTCTPLGTSDGVRTICWTGTINSDGTFNTNINDMQCLEMGGVSKGGYGLLSPTIYKKDDKVLLIGIVPDKLWGGVNYQMGWAHMFSLPREISLGTNGNLIQKPYSGLTAMRTNTTFSTTTNLNGTLSLNPVNGRQIELVGEWKVNGSGTMGFNFFKEGSNQAHLVYNASTGVLSMDLSGMDRTSQVDAPYTGGVFSAALPNKVANGGTLKLHVYVDGCIADIFVNDTWAFCVRMFPNTASALAAEAFSTTGEQASINAWTLSAGNTIQSLILTDDKDNTEVLEQWNTRTANVTINGRTLYKDGHWNSLCLPFNMTSSEVAASQLSEGTILVLNNAWINGNELHLEYDKTENVTAGKPFIIKWEEGADIVSPTFNGVILNTAGETEGLCTTTFDGGSISEVGTYKPVNVVANDRSTLYLTVKDSKDVLCYPEVNGSLRSHRAHLRINDTETANQLAAYVINFDDEVVIISGIDSVEADSHESTNHNVYDLQGRHMGTSANMPKGVYIRNGKKYVVK